jgi:hypothetical protein
MQWFDINILHMGPFFKYNRRMILWNAARAPSAGFTAQKMAIAEPRQMRGAILT